MFHVTLVHHLLQYFDSILYTIILLYLICLGLLRAAGETSYGIWVGLIGSIQSSLFAYIFTCI